MAIEWDRTKDEVLRENTAQAIHQQLEELDNERPKYERRWIWELFQNALDAAPKSGNVNISLKCSDRFVFEHDGQPFAAKEILHLIFHGSTKRDREDLIGRYGTGFLTTHIVSRKVRVLGTLETEEHFNVILDRSGNSPQELAAAMETSERMLRQSLTKCAEVDSHRTRFDYELTGQARGIVEVALSDLQEVAPAVLAFNKRISGLRIESHGAIQFVVRRVPLFERAHLVEICTSTGEQSVSMLVVVDAEDISIAIPVVYNNGRYSMESPGGLPRLFVAFPLLGTEGLPFPFLANCPRGKPTDERNGLYLGSEETPDNRNNKEYVEKCWDLFSGLVRYASEKLWGNLVVAGEVGLAPQADWLDKPWLNDLSRRFLQRTLIDTPLVLTDAGDNKSPKDVFFPTIEQPEELERHCSLVRAVFGNNVPHETVVGDWHRVVWQWEGLSDLRLLGITTISLNGLAQQLSSLKTLDNIEATIRGNGRSDLSAVEWLNSFFMTVLKCGEQNLFDKLPLLPNQAGVLEARKPLSQDDNMDEGLKDIAHQLGNRIREKLADKRVDQSVQGLLPVYNEETLVSALLKLVISKARGEYHTGSYREANAALFAWLASARRLSELNSYPLISSQWNDSGYEILVEERGLLLAPVEFWPPEARAFSDLFPGQSILSQIYVSHLNEDALQWLQDAGFFVCDPICIKARTLQTEEVAALVEKPLTAEQEDSEHKVADVEVIDIIFLTAKDHGLMDTVRNSKSKGAKFLSFVLNYVLPRTASYLGYAPFHCSCGQSHELHRALWLPTVKERRWVYERKGHPGPPTAQNLVRLWQEDPSLKNRLEDELVLLFLGRLGASGSEVMLNLAGKDSHEMQKAVVMLLNAAGSDPTQVQKVAEILSSDAELLEEFERRKAQRERTRLNQQLGKHMEELFRELFESDEMRARGLKISRTGKGSDFSIEHDYVFDAQEWMLQVESPKGKFLIELKSTSGASVSLTHAQAREASTKPEAFALCVIPLSGEPTVEAVRQDARFVTNIGSLLVTQVQMVEKLKHMQDLAAVGVGDIQVLVEKGEVRYRVGNQVWEPGLTFQGFVEFLVRYFSST